MPTADVYSDGALIYTLYRGYPSHPSCTIPDPQTHPDLMDHEKDTFKTCLDGIPKGQLQYEYHPTWATMLIIPFLLNYFVAWYVWFQVDKRKHFTWLACFLGLYPQFRAAMIIREIWRDREKGLAQKKVYERELSEAEVFLEAAPITFVMMYISGAFDHNIGNREASIHIDRGMFYFSLCTSIISASLGMAKVLKVISIY